MQAGVPVIMMMSTHATVKRDVKVGKVSKLISGHCRFQILSNQVIFLKLRHIVTNSVRIINFTSLSSIEQIDFIFLKNCQILKTYSQKLLQHG